MYTGTIQSQVSLQMLDLKWKKKKQDINSKKDTEGMTQDEILLDSLERQAQTERERSATSELYTKLKTGGTLTEEEIAYLKEHDPEALAEYEKAQTEKKAYENALKNCRTKEDVQRLKLNRMGSFAAQAKEIASNPYIPKDKKVTLMQRLNNEVCMIRDAHQAFEKSRAYEELPEEQELRREAAEEQAEDTKARMDAEHTGVEGQEDVKPEDSEKQMKMEPAEKDGPMNEIQSDTEHVGKQNLTKGTNNNSISNIEPAYTKEAVTSKSTKTQHKTTMFEHTNTQASTKNRNIETSPQSFTEISEDIERFLRRNHSGRGSFTAQA